MHLQSHTRKKKGKTYTYYSIAESYWKDKKNKKKILFYLGSLTPLQEQQIRDTLKVTQSTDTFIATFDDIIFEDRWDYLDIAFLNHLWDKEWGLSEVFPLPGETSNKRQKDIQSADVAKILTFCRCLNPGSYFSAVEWFGTTSCNHIIGINGTHFNDSRIYRELTVIEQQKKKIEQWLYQTLKKRNEESMRVIFYDLSDSYFEGRKCTLAKPGITKANGFKEKRIVLSLLVNSEGYPFSWEILDDYTSDVKTLTGNADRWKQKFNLSKIIMVFDRGMVSDDNLKHLENSKSYFYITALDKDQIAGVEGANLKRFETFTEETTEDEITSKGLVKYDDSTYYEDIGVDNNDRRHVLIFNMDLFKSQRKKKEELIEKAVEGLEIEREALLNAKRSRERKPTEKRIDKNLEKLKMQGYLDYSLKRVDINGKKDTKIRSFDLSYWRKTNEIEKAQLTDGVWMIVTNISATVEPEEFRLGPEDLIKSYRDKNRVEEAFKEVKSFLKFQPTFVYTKEHVRAHYTICILSYLLDMTVTNKLREQPIEGIGSVRRVHKTLKRSEIGKISVNGTKYSGNKLITPTEEQKSILELFDCDYLVEGSYLRSIGIGRV
jgi:transposase